jgi:hypothetical protein
MGERGVCMNGSAKLRFFVYVVDEMLDVVKSCDVCIYCA